MVTLRKSVKFALVMKRLYLIVISLCTLLSARASEPTQTIEEPVETQPASRRIYPLLGVDFRPSYIFSSYRDDYLEDRLDMDNATSTHLNSAINLKAGFRFSPDSPQGKFFPGVWQGIGAGLNLFNHPKGIGTPVTLYVFQGAPVWDITPRLSLFYEWNFGASFGWKPSDGLMGQSNLIVGSKVNAYINLGAGLLWHIDRRWSLTAGIDLTHFSNGNTSFPNPGVNSAGLRIGVTRSFGPDYNSATVAPYIGGRDLTSQQRHKISYDLTLYGAWRKRVYRGDDHPALLRGHFPVAGLNFAPMWEVARIFRTGISADFQWDQSTDLKHHRVEGSPDDNPLFYRPPFFSQVSAGLSARAELVMPIFSVNFGIGYNFISPSESRASYEMANLKVHLIKGLYLNVGYQLLNFSRQNNLMLGLGYTFHGNR